MPIVILQACCALHCIAQGTAATTPDLPYVLHTLPEARFAIECGFSPDGRYLYARHSNGVYYWDVAAGYPEMRHVRGGSGAIAYSPDSTKIVTGGGGRTITVHDVRNEFRRTSIPVADEDTFVSALRFSPDGKQLAVGMSRRVALYDFGSGTKLREFDSPFEQSGFAAQAAFLDRDRLLIRWSTRDDDPFELTQFDLNTGAVDRRPFPEIDRRCYRFAQSPSGRTIALVAVKGDSADVTAVDVATRKVLWKTPGAGMATAFSPDERYLALTGYLYEKQPEATAVRIFRVSDGKLVKNLKQKRKWFQELEYVRGLAFSPDGTTLATCSSNLPVTLWDWTKIEAELPK